MAKGKTIGNLVNLRTKSNPYGPMTHVTHGGLGALGVELYKGNN